MTTVDSSRVHAAGYDDDERELEVIFNSGRGYRYENGDKDEYEGLMAGASKGRYGRAHIIDMTPSYKLT